MSREMTNSEAISNLNHIYGIVSSDIQRSLDLAIKALEERPQDCSDCKRYDFPYFEIKFDKEQKQELVDKAKAGILANIETERPQGEWIKVKEERMSIDMSGEIATRYKCSKCGRPITILPSKLADYPFCHCGAEMRKGGKEE